MDVFEGGQISWIRLGVASCARQTAKRLLPIAAHCPLQSLVVNISLTSALRQCTLYRPI